MLYDLSDKDIERFKSKCFRDEKGILRWGGTLDKDGYGVFTYYPERGGKQERALAHRVAQDVWGDEPLKAGDWVLHDNRVSGKANRNVVDVRYLYIGDHKQNQRDMAEAGSMKGENHPTHKLSEAEVLEVYRRAWAGERPADLAIEFNVDRRTITAIKRGQCWSWLTGHHRVPLTESPVRGTNHRCNKLTEPQVLEVYNRAWAGESLTELGREFGITKQSVRAIKLGKSWNWLTGHVREEPMALAAD